MRIRKVTNKQSGHYRERDRHFISSAFTEALKGPVGNINPRVGALVTRNETIISQQYHAGAGSPHAEALAIAEAGAAIRHSTLYITLEPCHWEGHEKRTPPCSRMIIAARPARVVIAAIDPNPRERGRSLQILKKNGIVVDYLNMDHLFAAQNEEYVCRMRNGRPFVHLKWAQTLDGYSADSHNNSQWITDAPARAVARRLRAQCGAVLVGRLTVQQDNPQLTVRNDGTTASPVTSSSTVTRMVLDSALRLAPHLRVFKNQRANPTIVFHAADISSERLLRSYQHSGVQLVTIPRERVRALSLSALMQWCHEHLESNSVLVEGGAQLCGSFLKQELWDKISIFIAPTLLGQGLSASTALHPRTIQRALRPQLPCWETLASHHSEALQFSGYRNIRQSFHIALERYRSALNTLQGLMKDV